MIHGKYRKDHLPARIAQELAHVIAFGPVIFQVTRVMLSRGIFRLMRDRSDGITPAEAAEKSGLSEYAAKILLESSLTLGTVLYNEGRYSLSKVGWSILADPMVKVNMDFNAHAYSHLGTDSTGYVTVAKAEKDHLLYLFSTRLRAERFTKGTLKISSPVRWP